jgi:hypothetical protein
MSEQDAFTVMRRGETKHESKYQRWDQVPRRSEHHYKHGPLDMPEIGSGV